IARKLGKTFGNPNQFLAIRQDLESLEAVIDRFIRYTEGMTDGLAGYIDGFHVWKQLFEQGFSGYLRGDRPLCSTPPIDMDTVMKDLKVRPLDFYANGEELAKWFPKQTLPAELQFKEGEESLAVWQDRLIPLHYGPSIYAAMAECKAGFLEMSNPLLNRKIIKTAYPLRDKIGSVYEVYKKWVLDRTPDIPKGVENSNVNLKDILRSEDMVKMMREEFDRESAEKVFPRQLLTLISEPLKIAGFSIDNVKPRHTSRFKYWIKQLIPQKFTDQRKKKKKYVLDPNILGFRAFIVLRMVHRFEEDTRLFHHITPLMKSQVPD
ncbi:MAG: hypothetical protein KDE26_30810, partial [Bacteroidetes bacterium]|nr:hypothetical protein [Bacteroidota bacterium]